MFLRRVRPSRTDSYRALHPARLMRGFEQLLDAASHASRPFLDEPATGVFPALNITRDANAFYVSAELPGVDADELKIMTEGTKLSITGAREIPAEEGEVSYHRRERASGSFSRTVVLPNDVDNERVDARYVDGILTIALPLSESARARQIKVRTDQ